MKTKIKFLHELNSTVLFRGKPYLVHSRRYKNSNKCYRLLSNDGDSLLKPPYQHSAWIKEAYLMKYFDFNNR